VKAILIAAALGAALIAPAMAQQAPQSQTRLGWAARQHVCAAEYYARQNGTATPTPTSNSFASDNQSIIVNLHGDMCALRECGVLDATVPR
jgi:hypothetical protein